MTRAARRRLLQIGTAILAMPAIARAANDSVKFSLSFLVAVGGPKTKIIEALPPISQVKTYRSGDDIYAGTCQEGTTAPVASVPTLTSITRGNTL
jgi:hypothetical protein